MKDGNKTGKGKKKFSLRNIFYHNTFVLAFSFVCALCTWFLMAAGSERNDTYTIYDVPIEVTLSAEAEADGLRVFNKSYSTADIEVSGNSLITSKLTADDFRVTASLNPTSTKLTGNTLQKFTAPVRVVKVSPQTDYVVASFNPEEVNLEYDRYKEATLPLEDEVEYSVDNGFYPGSPVFSEESVTISGPESAVNKVSRVAVAYTISSPLRAAEEFSAPLRLYDQNGQEITDVAAQYLSLSVDSVQVTLPVMARKTVRLVANTLRQPTSFGENRITINPAEIDIAGPQDVLDGISEIRLATPIDFGDLDLNKPTPAFDMEIPLPAGVRNITKVGENTVDHATVTINLNGYTQATLSVPADNIQVLNTPAGKEPQLTTRSVAVTVVGPQAQVSRLTGDSIALQIDLTNFSGRTGIMEVPVTAMISGSSGESCWITGSYTVTLTLADSVVMTAGADPLPSGPSEGVVAKPQE